MNHFIAVQSAKKLCDKGTKSSEKKLFGLEPLENNSLHSIETRASLLECRRSEILRIVPEGTVAHKNDAMSRISLVENGRSAL